MSTSGSDSRFKRKNASGSRSDKGWDHGIDVDGNARKVKCKYCEKVFTGGIFRFKNHIACTHSNVEACISVPDDVKNEFRLILTRNVELSKKRQLSLEDDENREKNEINLSKNKGKGLSFGSSNKQSTLNQMMKKDLREEACQQIAKLFYTSAIPFNVAKNPEFIKAFELVGRYGCGFKPPSYHEIREKYLNKEVANVTKLLDQYKVEWKRTGCSIMSDGWSDRKRRSLVNFLVNSPKGTVFLTSLDTSHLSKTAEVVCEMLDRIVDMVGEENVVQVVTDNAANYKTAGDLLMQKRKMLYWTPCVAHCIDLMLEDLEKKLEIHRETITKGRKITTYIYGRTILISILRKFTKERDLVRAGATRFATAYLTLGSLNEHKGSLMSVFSSDAWKLSRYARTVEGKRIAQIVLDSEFWKNVVTCLRAAFPLIKVLRMVDSDKEPAMPFIYDAMDQAKQKIRDNFNNVKRSYEPIWNIIDQRWEFQMHRPLHAAAYFLNPRLRYNPDFNDDPMLKFGLYNCLQRMVHDLATRRKIDVQIEYFKQARGLFGIEAAVEARETKPPHTWWDAYGDECPELKKFAIRILSLTCSSSGCERNWSVFEMVHTKKRNRLHQKKMNDLVFVMHNLKLKDGRTRKDKEPVSFDDLDSDDEWITEDYDDEDVPNDPLASLDDTEKDTEEEDANQIMAILSGASTQQAEGDDLEIRDAFDMEGCFGNVLGGERSSGNVLGDEDSSGNVLGGEVGSSGISPLDEANEDVACNDFF